MCNQCDNEKICTLCNKEYSPSCDYRQGRCPHHPSLINEVLQDQYKSRFFNLIKAFKNIFK